MEGAALAGAAACCDAELAVKAPPWHALPDLVLVKLFGYLGPRERLSAGRMCRRWLAALLAAPLWRSVRVVLGAATPASASRSAATTALCRRGSWEEVRAAATVLSSRRYGPLVRRLEVRWARPFHYHHHHVGTGSSPSSPSSASSCHGPALHLLEALRAAGQAGHLQLSQLLLQDLAMSHKCNASAGQRGQLLAALAAFLGSQRRLQTLSLENACLAVSEALRLLAAAARCSSAALADLRLQAAFREWQAPHASPKFSRALRRLSPLSALSLNYPALSDATLLLLAECCGPALRSLSVTVRDTDHRQHVLSQGAWARAAAACPHLRVVLNIEHIGHFEEIGSLLLPAVPLCGFRLYSGSVWDQTRSRAFRATLRLLTAHYHQSLECVQLNLKNSREQLDDVVLELLARCRRLSFFQFDGVLRRLDTVKDICRLRLDAAINFQSILVRPKVASHGVRAAAKDIADAFQEPLSRRTVDFRIEVPAR